MSREKPRVAVLGCGYWGKNPVRNFYELGALRVVCDPRREALDEAQAMYAVTAETSIDAVLSNPEVDAVMIAAPGAQHYGLARKSLAAVAA